MSCYCFKTDYNKIKNSSNDIPEFSLDGYDTNGKIVDVYDGDSCKIVLIYKNQLTKFTVRMADYNCPELKSDNPIEKIYGQACKNIVTSMLLNKIVIIQCGKWDKYGRLLGHIYCNTPNDIMYFNGFIIEEKIGIPYKGKKKTNFNAYLGDNIQVEDIVNYHKKLDVIDMIDDTFTKYSCHCL
jgi:endonuclease YncB( thermonuclease family)